MTAKSVLMTLALAVACNAQTAAPAKPAKASASTAKAAAAKPAKSVKKAAAMPAAHKPAASAVHKAAKPAAARHTAAKAPATTQSAGAQPVAAASARKRDPFVDPIQAVREGRNASCSGGKRCLAVNEIVLRGIVKSVNGMIAVVENSAQRTYFLRENDAIYNGVVQKITPDSVVFREHYTDNLGRDQEREVVKNVNAPAV